MNRVKTFYVLLIISSIFINLIVSECESCKQPKKKEKNIYSKEANEGDFKHGDTKKVNQEDEIIDEEAEKEEIKTKKDEKIKNKNKNKYDAEVEEVKTEDKEEEKLDPEKAKEIMKVMEQLGSQLNDMYSKSFEALQAAIPEIQKVGQNVTEDAQKQVEILSKKTGKNLDIVSETISKVIQDTKTEIGEYDKVIQEKKKESIISESSLEIAPDLSSKEIAKLVSKEIKGIMAGGNTINSIFTDMPDNINVVLEKNKKTLNEKLTTLEEELDVDLTSVKLFCDQQLTEISTSLSSSLKQTSGILSMAMNTILSMVSALHSQFE